MEAYKVWVTLNLKGDALKKMEMFTAATKRATAAVDKLKIAMKPNVSLFDHMAVNLREINPELNKMAQNINKIDSASKRMNGSSRRGSSHRGSNFALGLGLINPYMAAGLAATGTMVAGFHQGVEYDRSMGQLAAMGYSNSQLKFARNYTSTARAGVSPTTQIEAFVDAQMATQSFDMAKSLSPIIAQNKVASQLYGGMSHKQVQDSIRTAEMIGGSNPQKVANALTTVLQMTALSGGSLMPSEQRAFMRQAAGSASRLTPEGYLALEPVMQEYGGSKTGTALTTGLRAFSNPQIANFPRYRVKQLENLGLWDHSKNRMKSEYLDLIQTDPASFTKLWLSKLSSHGVTKDADILTETTSAFPRTFGTLVSLLMKNMEKTERERGVIHGLPKGQELSGLYLGTQGGAQYRLSEAFKSFSKSLNDMTSPAIIGGMNDLAHILEKVANFINSFNSTDHGPSLRNIMGDKKFSFLPFNNNNKKDVTAGSIKKDVLPPIVTHVSIDGKNVATAVANHMAKSTFSHQVVHHGTSNINPLSAYPTAVSQGVG